MRVRYLIIFLLLTMNTVSGALAQVTDDSWVEAKYQIRSGVNTGQMSYPAACQVARNQSKKDADAACSANKNCNGWRETDSFCGQGLSGFNYSLKLETTDITGAIIRYEQGQFAGYSINAVCPDGTIVAFGSQCFVQKINDRSCKAGNPVSPGSGEKFHDETDYSGAGAHPLEFRRSYRSNHRGVPSIATGWRHSWQKNIDVPKAPSPLYDNTLVVKASDGTHAAYKFNGSNWLGLTNGIFDTLQETKINGLRTGWILKIWADDSTEYYDAAGTLLKITQRNGWTTSLTYSTSSTPVGIAPFAGLLINIANHFGRKLQLRYNDMGQLVKLIDPAGGEIQYGYDSNFNLTKVTWQDKTARQYLYGIPANGRLTGVIDELGVRIGTYAYDIQGRVTSTEKANGADKITLLYNADKSTSITDYKSSPTGVGAPTATTRIHRFGTAQGVIRPVSVTAPCTTCGNTAASTAYDASGNISQRTEHDGTVTKLTYDSKNRETSRVEAFGTAAAKTYTTQWHATWNLPTLRTEPFKITAYTYDEKGNLTRHADTPTTDVYGSKAAAGVRDLTKPILADGWVFDANNLPLSAITKSTALGAAPITIKDYQYNYDQFGNEVAARNALNSKSRSVAFNADGLPISGSLSTGVLFSYQYNTNGFVTTEKWGNDVTKIEWRKDSKIEKYRQPSGAYTQFNYDASGRYESESEFPSLGIHTVFINIMDVIFGSAWALPQDNWYGRTDPGFKDYVHGIKQGWGTGGAYNFNQQEIENLWKNWKEEGCPRGKGGKSGKGGSARGGGRGGFFRGGGRGLD